MRKADDFHPRRFQDSFRTVCADSGRPGSFSPIADALVFFCRHPLYAILVPHVQAEVIRSLIDIWRHEHFLPDW